VQETFQHSSGHERVRPAGEPLLHLLAQRHHRHAGCARHRTLPQRSRQKTHRSAPPFGSSADYPPAPARNGESGDRVVVTSGRGGLTDPGDHDGAVLIAASGTTGRPALAARLDPTVG
jgi:hypothetical protein